MPGAGIAGIIGLHRGIGRDHVIERTRRPTLVRTHVCRSIGAGAAREHVRPGNLGAGSKLMAVLVTRAIPDQTLLTSVNGEGIAQTARPVISCRFPLVAILDRNVPGFLGNLNGGHAEAVRLHVLDPAMLGSVEHDCGRGVIDVADAESIRIAVGIIVRSQFEILDTALLDAGARVVPDLTAAIGLRDGHHQRRVKVYPISDDGLDRPFPAHVVVGRIPLVDRLVRGGTDDVIHLEVVNPLLGTGAVHHHLLPDTET